MAKKDTKKPEKIKPEKKGKEKTKKNKKGADAAAQQSAAGANGLPPAGTPSVPLANMSPEQMTAAQLEQAIKESNDPSTRLKKLRSPINVRSCLLNILILVVLTLSIVILWSFFAVDKFNFVTVMSDMMDKFGITKFFTVTIPGWFGF